MINKAIEKLTKEMMKMNDPFAQAIEEHLTGICTNEHTAERILQEGKSLKGACDEIRSKARKGARGGVVIVSDVDAYRIAEEYFGIEKRSAGMVNVLELI